METMLRMLREDLNAILESVIRQSMDDLQETNNEEAPYKEVKTFVFTNVRGLLHVK